MNKITEIYVSPDSSVRILVVWETTATTNMQTLLIMPICNNVPCLPISIPKKDIFFDKAFYALLNIKGIDPSVLPQIIKNIRGNEHVIEEQSVGHTIYDAYTLLCQYVKQHHFPDMVFTSVSDDGICYGNIADTYLEKVLSKLDIDIDTKKLKRTFKLLGGLRVNNGTGHNYSFKIGKKWYFSFRLDTQFDGFIAGGKTA